MSRPRDAFANGWPQRRIDPQGAVWITEVDENSPAWNEGLRPDMMISHVGNKRVATPKDFHEAVANQTGPIKIRLTVARQRPPGARHRAGRGLAPRLASAGLFYRRRCHLLTPYLASRCRNCRRHRSACRTSLVRLAVNGYYDEPCRARGTSGERRRLETCPIHVGAGVLPASRITVQIADPYENRRTA